MSVVVGKPCCVACEKEITVLKCEDCWHVVCNSQLVVQCQETLPEGKVKTEEQAALIKQVDDWELNAMNQIRQTAKEARRLVWEYTADRISKVEEKLVKLGDQLRQCRQESDLFSKNVSHWQEELVQLSKQLVAPSSIVVRQVPSQLVTKIFVDIPALLSIPNISANAKWIQNGTTVAGGHGPGNGLNQFNYPYGLYVDDDQTIYVTDYSNHRVMEWKSGAIIGQVVAGGNEPGNNANQLNYPIAVVVDKQSDSLIIADYSNRRVVRWPRRNGTSGETIISDIDCWGLAMDNSGYLYVSDIGKHEVKRWKIGEMNGTVVAGGKEKGNRLDQLNWPAYIFVDQNHSVYVSEYNNHRVTKWMDGAKEGIIVAGGHGPGNALTQLKDPRGIVVDQVGTVYVADSSNHRVMRSPKGATEGSVVVGGNGARALQYQFNSYLDLSFDRQNNLFVSDGNRVQKFNIDPNSTR